MTDRESLLSAALMQPDDDTVRLVLADFLREQSDPADVARGRFLWAGVVAARYRSADLIEDSEFYAALSELSAVASDGWPAHWLAALGLDPLLLTEQDWGWDNVADRVTVRLGRVTGEFERGMLVGLTVTLNEWYATAPAALAAWPLWRVTVSDVPGMAFYVSQPEDPKAGWVLSAGLTALEVPVRRHGWLLSRIIGPHPTNPPQPAAANRWMPSATLPDRAALVAGVREASAALVARLREQAGDQWPQGPR